MDNVVSPKTKEAVRLGQLTRQEIELYAGEAVGGKLVGYYDDDQLAYTVIAFPEPRHLHQSYVVLAARIIGNWIVIEEDRTDKPLVEALLVNAKIPREQIILEYAGEKLPEQTKGE